MSVMNTNGKKDLLLVNAVKSGKDEAAKKAFEQLFTKYHKAVLGHVVRITKGDVSAEDLTMEAFEKAYENIGRYDEKFASFSTWLFTLTRNLFIDSTRKRSAETVYISDTLCIDEDGNVAEKEFNSGYATPLGIIEADERNKFLHILIAETFKGKPHLQEVIELRYFSDLSYEEIRAITGSTLPTLKTHLFRARVMLKEACIKKGIKLIE